MTVTTLAFAEEPAPLTTPQEYADFTEAWLANRRLADNTRAAYRRDVSTFLGWAFDRGLVPLAARFTHVNEYGRWLEATPDSRTGRLRRPATVARMLTGLSSWFDFMTKMELIGANPVAGADRPRVDRDHSATVGLSPREVDDLLRAAAAESLRSLALLSVLADLGVRVSEAVGLELADIGFEQGHRTIRFTGKGGRVHRRRLSPGAVHSLERYLAERAGRAGVPVDELAGPVFVTSTGKALDRQVVFKTVRRLARLAGIESWASLSPHSLRHAFATTARGEGVPLEDVQDAMGHADPRTTRRYDRDRHNLDRDPSYTVWLARAQRGAVAA